MKNLVRSFMVGSCLFSIPGLLKHFFEQPTKRANLLKIIIIQEIVGA